MKYRVEMSIADESAEGLFVCFDGVMKKLHNMRAYEASHILAGDGVNPEKNLRHLHLLQAWKVKPPGQGQRIQLHFTANHQTFTISRILSEGDRMPLPAFVDNGCADDNGDDNSGAILVCAKIETGGSSQMEGSSEIMTKAHRA